MTVPDDAGRWLLPIARAAIAERLGLDAPVAPDAAWLGEPGACFVTLTQQGRLRGCIGSLEAFRPLGADVAAHAVDAAVRDPRFPPLAADELAATSIEVSVLSAPEPFPVADEADACARLRPGVDGVILTAGRRRATFLPQVWDELAEPRRFLAQLKRKAGLEPGYWGADLRLATYTVRAWSE